MFITSTNADTKSITPQEFAQSISETPSKVIFCCEKRVRKQRSFKRNLGTRPKRKTFRNKIFKN